MTELLWEPSAERCERANLTRFWRLAEERSGRTFATTEDLWRWSVEDLEGFWQATWDSTGLVASRAADAVLVDPERMPGARFFPGAELSFAENLLRPATADRDAPAILAAAEDRPVRSLTRGELMEQVARCARGLRELGVGPGERVAAFMPNVPETVIAMLAATSLGATWTSCSPDFGRQGVLDRFGQVEPRVLLTADGTRYGGKAHDSLARAAEVAEALDSVRRVVVVPFVDERPDVGRVSKGMSWAELLGLDGAGSDAAPELELAPFPFDHPLYVMYSSGTTGLPKCMVQGAGGVLVNHLKEHQLHVDLHPGDRIFYFTTCGWMMWNWLVGALASEAAIVLYEGSPLHPDPLALWRLADELEIDVFGTSAKYLAAVEHAGVVPREACRLDSVRTILSTGSPLSPESFRWVYRDVKEDVLLASISGGTDLNGCFALGNPLRPVHAGELQCRGLGMNVAALSASGQPVVGERGELACLSPFPSMPLHFWNDPDGSRYRAAYFERFPGTWCHGDWVEVTERGSVIVHGRSDATLNPGGVRLGTAEIYRIVEQLDGIADSLVVGQEHDDDERVVLFVRLDDDAALDDARRDAIRRAIQSGASPRHVPAVIAQVSAVPYTISGKKVELAVRNVIHGRPVTNRDALANPEALDEYPEALRRAEG